MIMLTERKKLVFKNITPFRSCVTKITKRFVDNTENLNIIPKDNLLEYSNNYSMASGSLWNYYKDEGDDAANENNANGFRKNNNKTTTSKSVKYKTILLGKHQIILTD